MTVAPAQQLNDLGERDEMCQVPLQSKGNCWRFVCFHDIGVVSIRFYSQQSCRRFGGFSA